MPQTNIHAVPFLSSPYGALICLLGFDANGDSIDLDSDHSFEAPRVEDL